ncbi:MAG: hypothetical protein JO153_08580 [Solirubrobacterales bacterium]|nr:hypothetical protein [Solirubrobacterales bacterium]MBV9916546.1 hypothetical protein [Solirubrobacterales bacterium]
MRKKALATAIVVTVGMSGLASSSLARQHRLGNGPPAPARAPIRSQLPKNRALIVVQLRHGKVVGLAGTALLRGATRRIGRPSEVVSALCSVNFTQTKTPSNGKTIVNWFGGIGCDKKMFLFGQAFLQESATQIDDTGPHYQKADTSAASGRNGSVVNAPHPSLYIRHETNVYFSPAADTGTIAVYPAQGQTLNGASYCKVTQTAGLGTGVFCDLYTNRF